MHHFPNGNSEFIVKIFDNCLDHRCLHKSSKHTYIQISSVTKYSFSKLHWWLSVYNLSETWIIQNLNDKVTRLMKYVLHFHCGANLNHLKFSISKFHFGQQFLILLDSVNWAFEYPKELTGQGFQANWFHLHTRNTSKQMLSYWKMQYKNWEQHWNEE